MNNHYHLLLRTIEANLSRSMQWFGTTYTRRYNLRHGKKGHLFQGRFKSIIIEDDSYLFQLFCYIHRNPLRARMVKRLADYKWSSYRTYAYKHSATSINSDWLKTELILSHGDAKDRHRSYRERVQRYSDEKKKIAEDIHFGIVAGTRKFAERIKKEYLPDKPDQEIPHQKRLKEEFDLADIVKKASRILDCDIELFKKSYRISSADNADKNKRDLLLYLLWRRQVHLPTRTSGPILV